MKTSMENRKIEVSGKFIKIARLGEEWYVDVTNPQIFMDYIRTNRIKADILTFWQRLPDVIPEHNYQMEWDSIAVLPVSDFNYWFTKTINSKERNLVRKAQKKGVVIKLTRYDDQFVKGITEIFNETPIRQGKPFWHYGLDYNAVKTQFSKNIHREKLIGAYFDEELIGFIMLANAGKYAMMTQIISKVAHRDKSVNNALIAKAVEVCAQDNIPYLVYASWVRGSLGNFKKNNGFEKIDLPRYYVPLTIWGSIVLKLNLHHGIIPLLPDTLVSTLIKLRNKWYSRKLL